MEHEKIVSRLSLICPSEIIYSITMQNVLSALKHRLGEKALDLSAEDLELAIQEIRAAIDHQFDPREYIDMGLDAWMITRFL